MMRIDGVAADRVAAADRGLHYGDGLFETMRLHAGRVPLLARHLARLTAGCRYLGLPYPGDELLADDVAALVAAGPGDAVVKIILTRGEGGRGYAPPSRPAGCRIVARYPLPPLRPAPLVLGLCRTRLGSSPALAGLKHLGRLEQVLAAAEVESGGWDEGLMLDAAGAVIEATRHNCFYLRHGGIWTPPVSLSGVAGVMRALVLAQLPGLGLAGGEAPLRYDELHEIEGLFLCNAVAGLQPVARVAELKFGVPAVLLQLRASLAAGGVTWLA